MFKHKRDDYGENGLPLQSRTEDGSITEPTPGGAFSSLSARLTAERSPAPAVGEDDDGSFYDVAGLDPLTECSDEQLQKDPVRALRAAARDLEAFAAAAERFQRAGWEVCVELDDDDKWQLAVTAPEGMSDEDALTQERALAGPLAVRFDEFAPADEDEDQ
jgi:hypothetical protein